MRPSKGDLVYVPSHVNMYKFYFSEQASYLSSYDPAQYGNFDQYVTLDSPKTLLLTENKLLFKKYYKVWYDGGEWYVLHSDVKQGGN